MKLFLCFIFLISYSLKIIICGANPCFEYSCDECESPEYGKCTKCRDSWTLIDGKCPCSDINCALCYSGLAGLNLCQLCKNGYYRFNFNCYCEISNCEHCSEDGCLKCITGYTYNSTTKACEKQKDEDKLICFDSNCDTCFSEEKGGCTDCKEGYLEKKGECIENLLPDENNTCPDGYYLSGNYCLEKCDGLDCSIFYSRSFFTTYYTCSSNKCLICGDNELKIFSECDNSEECSEIEGCSNCISNEECLICNQGYYLIGGICKKCIEGCALCSNEISCEYCMSGYQLNSEKKCNLTYNYDYSIDLYNNYKERMIEYYYPEEVPTTEPLETIPPSIGILTTEPVTESIHPIIECPSNCAKCYDNIGKCLECEQLYILKENQCIKHCSDEKCLDCKIEDNAEKCNECSEGYKPDKEKCSLICSIENCSKCKLSGNTEYCYACKDGYKLENNKCTIKCEDDNCKTCSDNGKICTECQTDSKLFEGKCALQSVTCSQNFLYCKYCLGSEKCVECLNGYELNNSQTVCNKKANIIAVIFIILGIIIIIIGIISFCIYQRRKMELREDIRRMRFAQRSRNNQQNGVFIYQERNEHSNEMNGSKRTLTKQDLSDEYELQKKKSEKGKKMCQFCNKKQAKYTCDCGCMVCKEHSSLKIIEGDGEKYKVCYACEKVVKRVTPIKYDCHICLQKRLSVAHFKCGCALEVCKDCYIKCKSIDDKCPGCRRII